jgi:Na+/melibiose symporter-like transporter
VELIGLFSIKNGVYTEGSSSIKNSFQMALNQSKFWTDVAFLMLYFIFSPFFFGFFYPQTISGDSNLIYLFILFIALITLFISVIISYFVRKKMDSKWIELYVALIPFIVSSLIILPLSGSNNTIIFTFLGSNTAEIAFLYITRKLFLG